MKTRERLECGARMLDSIDTQRRSRNDPTIFTAAEGKIVGFELEELAAEWRANPELPITSAARQLSGWRISP